VAGSTGPPEGRPTNQQRSRHGDRVVGRAPFLDGATREVYEDKDGRQREVGYGGERVSGVWLAPADEPLMIEGASS
jgi:hypothetical protein